MNNNLLVQDILETTDCLSNIICEKRKENIHGEIKGYLVPDDICCVIQKKERKFFSSRNTQTLLFPCLGSVKCSESRELIRTFSAMIIAYAVRNNLMNIFAMDSFKRFEIELETYPKYKYDESSIWKYKRTGDDISLLKTHIEW